MNIHRIFRFFASVFRAKRMRQFLEIMEPTDAKTILDIGGYPETWSAFSFQSRIVLLNLPEYSQKPATADRFEYIFGDGRALNYPDNAFDIVFSNSVLEHVGTLAEQQQFVREALRVGKSYWIQTPAKEFFIDPHLLTPFVHWLPQAWMPKLLRYFTVWGLLTRPTQEQAMVFWESLKLRMLTYNGMKQLFPEATILTERFLGMPKSYIACSKSSYLNSTNPRDED